MYKKKKIQSRKTEGNAKNNRYSPFEYVNSVVSIAGGNTVGRINILYYRCKKVLLFPAKKKKSNILTNLQSLDKILYRQ